MREKNVNDFTSKLLRGYSNHYDINVAPDCTEGLVAVAEYHVSETGYILVRKAETWKADSDEYVYFIVEHHLTKAIAEEMIDNVKCIGLERINIKDRKHHMCTRLVVLFICDEIDKDAWELIRKYKMHKEFLFGFKGWMDVHTVAVALDQEGRQIVSNKVGKDTAEFINQVLS